MRASKLRDARDKLGLTQAEFWDAVGVSQSTGSRYEKTGARLPQTVIKLLKVVYDLSVRVV